jgi:transcription termination/antitermination protein NusG
MIHTRTYAPWVALQIRPKMERTVAEHLAYRGYEHFLPMRRRSSAAEQSGTETPVFPGYLFCRYSENAAGTIVSTPGVSRIVSFGGTPAWIDDQEIAGLQQAIACRLPLVPLASFVPGAQVVITKGPLQGVRGVVMGIKDKRYLVISITMLGRSVAVELHAEYVRSQYPAAEYQVA